MATLTASASASSSSTTNEESEAIQEYRSTLCELTLNSKPYISMLTMLAEENKAQAADIVRCIEQRLQQVDASHKLPLLYLMDSICKNIHGVYVKLFTQNIVSNFCHVFEKGDEKTRLSLFKLRQTWNDIFPARKLYAVDVRIQKYLDPAWPVTAKPDGSSSSKHESGNSSSSSSGGGGGSGGHSKSGHHSSTSSSSSKLSTSTVSPSVSGKIQQQVHINPKFLNEAKQAKQIAANKAKQVSMSGTRDGGNPSSARPPETDMITAQLYQKQQELLALEKQKLELEMLTAKRKLEEKERALREREDKLKKKELQLVSAEANSQELDNSGHQESGGGHKQKKPKKRPRAHRSRSPSPVQRKTIRSPQHNNQRQVQLPSVLPQQPQTAQQQAIWSKRIPKRSRSPIHPWASEATPGVVGPPTHLPQRTMMSTSHASDTATIPTTIPAPSILAQPDMRSIVSMPCVVTQNGGVGGCSNPIQSMTMLNMPEIVSISVAPVTNVTTTTLTPLVSHGIVPGPQPPPIPHHHPPPMVGGGPPPGPPMIGGPAPSSHVPVPHQDVPIPLPLGWRQDRDYRRSFEAMMFEADQRLRSGALSTHDHDILVREIERARHQNIGHEMPSIFKQENLCSSAELTMLVDGKLRKLYYLDDSIAVVLMNAHQNSSFNDLIKMDPNELDPRQISFDGKPTKVFIDSDRGSREFVLLEFNNQPQTFFHNEHEQRIKFGGPAKEIILNGKAYQAKFGGPPIEVWFAGDTLCTHSLRLDGPPPRVKLSEQPRIDYWNRIVDKATKPPVEVLQPPPLAPPTATTNVVPAEQPPVAAEPPVNIKELLQKLVAAGIINKEVAPEPVRAPEPPLPQPVALNPTPVINSNISSNFPTGSRNNANFSNPPTNPLNITFKAPSPPSTHNEDSSQQQNLPPEPMLKLTSESLKIPRPSVIASLYNGIQCTNCSLRFDDKDNVPNANRKSNYAKHLDWHFRQNRKDKAKPNASAASLKRGWYYTIALWLQFREVSDEDEATTKKAMEEAANEESVGEEVILTVAASSDEANNQCSVCGEKFDLIWMEDDEEWRLKNAVTHTDGRNYHPFCLDDLIKQHEQHEMMQEAMDTTTLAQVDQETRETELETSEQDHSQSQIMDLNTGGDLKLDTVIKQEMETDTSETPEEESKVDTKTESVIKEEPKSDTEFEDEKIASSEYTEGTETEPKTEKEPKPVPEVKPVSSTHQEEPVVKESESKSEDDGPKEDEQVKEPDLESTLTASPDKNGSTSSDGKPPDLTDEATGAPSLEEAIPPPMENPMPKETKLTLNLKNKVLIGGQKDKQPTTPTKSDGGQESSEKERKIYREERVETSALCVIM